MKTMKKIVAMSLAFALAMSGLFVYHTDRFSGKANSEAVATPTSQLIQAVRYGERLPMDISENIPLYSIIQDNGWGANYVKLRDIAFYMDFGVEWNAAKPNEMRIYTNRHYLEPLNSTGPATETKTAVKSTMDIYIDDVKVDVDAYMIDNNNYFKIRDLAKAVGFGCSYFPANNNYPARVGLHANYPYQDGDFVFTDANYPTKRVINYVEYTPWYDSSSGMHDEPVVNRIDNPWARMDYYAMYGDEVGEVFVLDGEDSSVFNAVMQLLIDWDEIVADQSGAWVENQFVEGLNPNYMYPICKSNKAGIGSSGFEVMWAMGIKGVELEKGENLFVLTPRLNDTYNRVGHAGYSRTIEETKTQAAAIYTHMNTLSTDREKVTYLANEVCKRITYQYWQERTLPDVSSTLLAGTFWNNDTQCGGVCEDYYEAFAILAATTGYEVISLRGHDHAWNLTYLKDEGKWVVVDCTWGDKYPKYICMDLSEYEYDSSCSDLRLMNVVHAAQAAGY